MTNVETLREVWQEHWDEALALWSRWTRLTEPKFCLTTQAALEEGLTDSFAMIRFRDQAVVIDLEQVEARGLRHLPLEVMGHEIGHHVLCPADLLDQGRLIARIRRGLPGAEQHAGLVANLYADILINDHLQRQGQQMAQVFKRLGSGQSSPLWTFYMRLYEVLWSLNRGDLTPADVPSDIELDAQLGARLVRSYARDWLRGGGRFAMLCLPYLPKPGDAVPQKGPMPGCLDPHHSPDEVPAGLTEIDPDEVDGAIHPRDDAELSGVPVSEATPKTGQGGGQARPPFEYGQILQALGLDMSTHDIAVRYYRERAQQYLIPYPTRPAPESQEPLPEGLEAWDSGSPLEEVDWLESVMVSPRPIPGFTTVRRTYGTMQGRQPKPEPIDLDMYVDSSGSMPNPQTTESFLALAGAIIARSALKVGARVQVTLWSGPNQFVQTRGFVSDETEVLRVLTGSLQGGTAFPLSVLRDTYARPLKRKVHVMVISDDGVDTMLNQDEHGTPGQDVARAALQRGDGGGSLVLQLYHDPATFQPLQTLADIGFDIYPIKQWDELVAFARAFSRKAYGKPVASR